MHDEFLGVVLPVLCFDEVAYVFCSSKRYLMRCSTCLHVEECVGVPNAFGEVLCALLDRLLLAAWEGCFARLVQVAVRDCNGGLF